MQTNNTNPIATVYTVITYKVFGSIETTVGFYSKEDAEKNVIDWANDNSYSGAAFTSADEAIDWFVDADENVEVSIRLEETLVYGNKTYYDEDMEMLASENMFMGEFLSKLGYSQDEVSEIANTSMLESPTLKVWGVNKHGQEVKEHDMLECVEGSSKWNTHVLFMDDGDKQWWHRECDYYDAKVIGSYMKDGGDNVSNDIKALDNDENRVKGICCINRAEATIFEEVETHQSCDNCGTHESQYIMSQCPKCGYIGSKVTLSAVYPKVGMQVCVGGYDDNASAGQQRFVDEHFGQLFEVLEVGNYSSKLKNVPFRVKHAHVYEIVGQGEGK